MNRIDTSIKGFEYVGIRLTEQQYEDMVALNLQMQCHPEIPAFHMTVLLKILGILPQEMLSDNSDSFPKDSEQWYQRRYGKRKE